MTKKSMIWIGESTRKIEVVDRQIVHCKTFGDFVSYFMSISTPEQLPCNISLSIPDVFENGLIDPMEYIKCYTNFIKLTNQRFGTVSDTIDISVRVGTQLMTRKQAEILQNTNVVGIGPMQAVYGKDALLDVFNDRKKYGASWPEYLISNRNCNNSDVITLTERQQVIFDLIRNRGVSNKQIAKYLNISESAVKFHVGHILKKYSLKNRTQLAALKKSV